MAVSGWDERRGEGNQNARLGRTTRRPSVREEIQEQPSVYKRAATRSGQAGNFLAMDTLLPQMRPRKEDEEVKMQKPAIIRGDEKKESSRDAKLPSLTDQRTAIRRPQLRGPKTGKKESPGVRGTTLKKGIQPSPATSKRAHPTQ